VTVVTEHVFILVTGSGNDDSNSDNVVVVVSNNDHIWAYPDFVRKGFCIIETLENTRNKPLGVVSSLTVVTLCFS